MVFSCQDVQNKKGSQAIKPERDRTSLIKNAGDAFSCANRKCWIDP